jgi:hypothetical protein
MNTRILPIKANSSTPISQNAGLGDVEREENVKSTGPNRKYQRREGLEQTDAIYLLVMIMDRKTNKITKAYIFTGYFLPNVLGTRHFIDATPVEK